MACVITGVCAFEASIQRPQGGEAGLSVCQRRRAEGRTIKELWSGFDIMGLIRHVTMQYPFRVPAGVTVNSQSMKSDDVKSNVA